MAIVTDALSMNFGGVKALDGVSLEIGPDEIIGIIGPNESGKTTLLNCLSGFYRRSSGSIEIDGVDASSFGPAQLRAHGLVRTFQNLRVYDQLTVLENAVLGMHHHLSGGNLTSWRWAAQAAGLPRARAREKESEQLAALALQRVGLGRRLWDSTGDLSYGEKKRLEIARATVGDFRYLLLDEPTAGLSPREASTLLDAALEVISARPGTTLVLVEHRLEIVVRLSTRMMLFDSGRLIVEGGPTTMSHDPEVIRVYTGGAE